MGSTYISLVNRVLRRINEVEVTEPKFASVIGIQSTVKDCVMDAINEIQQDKWQWPFLAVNHTETLVKGQTEYAWPADYQSVDWGSFQIEKDETLNINSTHLDVINKEEWYQYYRDIDDDNSTDGLRPPRFVFKTNSGWGVTPAPNEAYEVSYKYFKELTQLAAFGDVCDIPSHYDNVITWGALSHLNLFRENPDGYNIARSNFEKGIKSMYVTLIGVSREDLTDKRVNFGGSLDLWKADNYKW